jgi:4-hydroxy-tetrahydrodipicolinate reductase
MTRVVVAGAAGRMGATTCDAVEGSEDLELAGRADPALGVELSEIVGDADVVVDFTTPEVAPANVRTCVEAGVHAVVGTTGFDHEPLRAAAADAGGGANVLVAPNFAIGAVLMMRFAAQAAAHMPEVEIIELHHDRKLDAPSGTAKRTAELVGEAGGHVHEPIHSVRLPGLVAHQEVILGAEGQTLTIRHDSIDRSSFMPGVLLAIRGVGSLSEPFTVGLEALLDRG